MSKPENQRFPVRKLATSHCTDLRILQELLQQEQKRVRPKYFIRVYEKACRVCSLGYPGIGHTRKSVQSPLVVLNEK